TAAMKPYLVVITTLLILVQNAPGGLFRSHSDKSEEPWDPCELYQGRCRNACREDELQHFTCPHAYKCCLKFTTKREHHATARGSVTPAPSFPQS
uniref:Beta-defensin n=1 Tax=Oryctolagus cuniculus TaxID=9986 RepID=A0A5F9DI95_RABIT